VQVRSSNAKVVTPSTKTLTAVPGKVATLVLKAGTKPGKAAVTLTAGGKTLKLTIAVAKTVSRATSLTVSAPKTVRLSQPNTLYRIQVKKISGTPASPVATFTVDKKSKKFLSVSKAGVITPKKTGRATIAVTADKTTKKITITIKP
jgi:hypothetical protein